MASYTDTAPCFHCGKLVSYETKICTSCIEKGFTVPRKEYLPAPPREIALDLAILRADRDVHKQEMALNKAVCALHPHKEIVASMKSMSQSVTGPTLRRFLAVKLFRARNNP